MRLALLLAALAPGAAAQAPAQAPRACCSRPQELPPRAPQRRALCHGFVWSLAEPGRCLADYGVGGGACREGALFTLVTVREYALSWNEGLKQCVLISTGKTAPAPLPTCDGNSC